MMNDDMRSAVASPLRDININNNNINVIDDDVVGQRGRSRRRLGVGTDSRSCEERVGDMTRQTAILHRAVVDDAWVGDNSNNNNNNA